MGYRLDVKIDPNHLRGGKGEQVDAIAFTTRYVQNAFIFRQAKGHGITMQMLVSQRAVACCDQALSGPRKAVSWWGLFHAPPKSVNETSLQPYSGETP